MSTSDNSELDGWAHTPFLAKITDIAPNIIYIYNQQTHSNEYSNRSIGESLGYTTKEIRDMGNSLFLELCHPDDLPTIAPYMNSMRQLNDGEVLSHEYRMRHKHGRWVWLLSFDTVFERDECGDVIRHLGVATDISEQKEAQAQAQSERRAAETANDELQTFAYSMSHDMKAPSNTLHLLLSELKEQHGSELNEDANTLLDMSLNTVSRMRTLVESVLSYTRVVGQETDCEAIDLCELIEAVKNDLLADSTRNDAQFYVDELPNVRGNQIQVRILFQNLIANAVKYHVDGSQPKVSISSTVDESADMVLIHVKDNGIGIPTEHQNGIFDMFKRLHANSVYPGTGLGLAVCKRIAVSHGGDVSVVSTVDEGATFTVSFKR